MFCRNCGKEVSDNAVVCPYCGAQLSEFKAGNEPENKEYSIMAIVGLVLSFFFSLAGLVCSIIGYKQCVNENKNGKGFALAGIIISALSVGLTVLLTIAIIAAGSCLTAGVISSAPY